MDESLPQPPSGPAGYAFHFENDAATSVAGLPRSVSAAFVLSAPAQFSPRRHCHWAAIRMPRERSTATAAENPLVPQAVKAVKAVKAVSRTAHEAPRLLGRSHHTVASLDRACSHGHHRQTTPSRLASVGQPKTQKLEIAVDAALPARHPAQTVDRTLDREIMHDARCPPELPLPWPTDPMRETTIDVLHNANIDGASSTAFLSLSLSPEPGDAAGHEIHGVNEGTKCGHDWSRRGAAATIPPSGSMVTGKPTGLANQLED
ncbi:hypothetical protein CT0861_03114 [Colletotrichum tofieldiae]|uniref:Uncharacterized protein n=1 Tax=Colletotrichum tofieldiae TaxID=708197 RepID=A0A166Y747_9PEZI|nr:hypothetical protein CT0861_03114 [Colletotrichum tofieldiae]